MGQSPTTTYLPDSEPDLLGWEDEDHRWLLMGLKGPLTNIHKPTLPDVQNSTSFEFSAHPTHILILNIGSFLFRCFTIVLKAY